jgi:osmotically inducible lipoprotein OsmB
MYAVRTFLSTYLARPTLALAFVAMLGLSACEVGDETWSRTGTGAAVGAGAGAVTGLLTGDFLSKTLTGAAAGGAGGFIYDQIERR